MNPEDNSVTETLCKARIKALIVRLEAMDKALMLKAEDVDRRICEANEIKKEVKEELVRLGTRQTVTETRAVVWFGVLTVVFIIAQIVILYIKG